MKKKLFKLVIGIAVIAGTVVFLNIEATTRQGINYEIGTIKIPLYLKIIDFMDRHYNYGQLVYRIIGDERGEQEKAMALFYWTFNNIHEQPAGLPVIDDHVWHIIVRGYGVEDQFSDVFTTLCNYAGIDAFFDGVYTKDNKQGVILSFVCIKNKWTIFDPYRGVYFRDGENNFADIVALKSGKLDPVYISNKPDINYVDFLDSVSLVKEAGSSRSSIQSPINRVIFMVKKKLQFFPIKF